MTKLGVEKQPRPLAKTKVRARQSAKKVDSFETSVGEVGLGARCEERPPGLLPPPSTHDTSKNTAVRHQRQDDKGQTGNLAATRNPLSSTELPGRETGSRNACFVQAVRKD